MKRIVILTFLSIIAICTFAVETDLTSQTKCRIVCAQFNKGGLVVGTMHGTIIPFYYSTTATTDYSDALWLIEQQGNGKYSIKNAATNKYLTYKSDKSYYNDSTRNVIFTDKLAPNDSSLWRFNKDDVYYAITNAAAANENLNVRASSFIVGTYDSGSDDHGSNELFQLYNTNGDLLTVAEDTDSTQTSEGDFSDYLGTFTINGKAPVYDNYYKQYMAIIPDSLGEDRYRAIINYQTKKSNKNYTLHIDENEVNDSDYYDFTEVTGNKTYTISISEGNTIVRTSKITFTTLPIVELNGKFSTLYSAGNISVHEYGTPYDSIYNARLKWRGATALGYKKKSYSIKLYDQSGICNDSTSIDRTFCGLRSDNNWILDAAYIDLSRCRNRVSTDLWNSYSQHPYYFDKEPKLINGTRGHFVEVLLNGSYLGLYCLTEKVDRKQLKLKKYDEEKNNIRGVLYKASQWSYEVFFGYDIDNHTYPATAPKTYNNNSETWASWEVKYPDLGDGQPIDWGPLWDAINMTATSNNTVFEDSVDVYIDTPVLRDYYLLLELICGLDNRGKNMYFYSYDRNKYKKLSMAPWDLDGTWGRNWNSLPLASNLDYINKYAVNYNLFKRLKELKHGEFSPDSLAYRYAVLRQRYFNADSLSSRFATYMNSFISSGAATRETSRWSASDIATELSYITNWVNERINYLDNKYDIGNIDIKPTSVQQCSTANIFSVWSNQNHLYVESNRTSSISIYTLYGIHVKTVKIQNGVTDLGIYDSGIYIVGGKKVIVQ
jgi:hypothetical protein